MAETVNRENLKDWCDVYHANMRAAKDAPAHVAAGMLADAAEAAHRIVMFYDADELANDKGERPYCIHWHNNLAAVLRELAS